MPTHQRSHALIPVLDHQDPFSAFSQWYFWISLYMAVQTLTRTSFGFLHNTQHLDCIINATDYWPFERVFYMECCSSHITVLDSWSGTSMFSVVPLNKSTMLSFTLPPHTCYANNLKKFYSVSLWPCLMQPLRAILLWKMKDMRVEVKISTYPLLSDRLPESTMFPVMWTSPLTLLHHAPQLPANHAASLSATSYHSIALMTKKVPQLTFHLLTAPHHHRTPWTLHSSHCSNPSIPYVMT